MTPLPHYSIRVVLLGFLVIAHGVQSWGAATPAKERERQAYAPSRQVDILHLALDLTPDFSAQRLAGIARYRFKPIAQPVTELHLDAVELRVSAVTASVGLLNWQADDREVVIHFADAIPAGKEVELSVQYAASPKRGLFFRTPEIGYPAADMHLFTQGEAIDARCWFPCFDAPNEKYTSEVTCRVPADLVVLSNGRLISREPDPQTGLIAWRWLQDKPHVSYLVALAAGRFQKVEDRYRDIPLAFYVPASQIDQAALSFADTRQMLEFYEQETGVPYPWAKYDQVCVDDFTAGGMENTSLTILNSGALYPDGYETLRDNHGLVAHELVHQWFGDYVTCKDWAHVWLNEGFATYYEERYQGHRLGREEFQYRLYQSAQDICRQTQETRPIVRRDFQHPDEQFSYLTYPKGAWVVHMLQCQLGDPLFRKCVQTYLERHALDTVVTEDLNAVIEELSGQSFDRFFDQWVYHPRQPELKVEYHWDERAKLAKIRVQQTQSLKDGVMVFHFPLPLRFQTKSGVIDREVFVKELAEDFYLALPEAPQVVRVDPELTVLARVDFHPPRAQLEAQLDNAADMVGRLLAVEQLSGQRDALDRLQTVLKGDAFYGVRLAASRAIRAINQLSALSALIDSLKQPDARVRLQVVQDIAGFYHENAYAALRSVVIEEKNPEIRATALVALGTYARPELDDLLGGFLRTPSYRQVLADAALRAMRRQDREVLIQPVLDYVKQPPATLTTGNICLAMDVLAWLSRHEPHPDAAREWLLPQLQNPKERIRISAMDALATLGDARAIDPLESIAGGLEDTHERRAAERAVARLRDARKPGQDLQALRTEMLSLQRENAGLRKDLDDLKKQWETWHQAQPVSPRNRPARRSQPVAPPKPKP